MTIKKCTECGQDVKLVDSFEECGIVNADLKKPCSSCKHNVGYEEDEPCYSCLHNI